MRINWTYIQDKFDWLGHIVEAVVQAAIISVLTWAVSIVALAVPSSIYDALLIGGAVAVGHFWGREKRDYERHVSMPPPQIKAYAIWRWTSDNLTDFLPVLAIYVVYCGWYLYKFSPVVAGVLP